MENYRVLPLRRVTLLQIVMALALLNVALTFASTQEEGEPRKFDNGHKLKGRFLEYWTENRGLETFGPPISDELEEKSDLNGTAYKMQYFAYVVFELHPENLDRPNDVLLMHLGREAFKHRYPAGTTQQSQDTTGRYFTETQKWAGGSFLDFWRNNGAIPLLGMPISGEIVEPSDVDGKPVRVQYFERAVLEFRPGGLFEPEVFPRDLGRQRWVVRHGEWYEKLFDEPGTVIYRFLAENPGIKIVGIPTILAFVALLLDKISAKNEGNKTKDRNERSPEPYLEFSLNLPVLALAVDLTELADKAQKAPVLLFAILLNLISLGIILLLIRHIRHIWVEKQARTLESGIKMWTAVCVGLLSLFVSFWVVGLP
jgi:hypothetical protein